MSQVRENLTELTGTVEARRPHPALPGYDEVALRVESAQPVEGKADMLAPAAGDLLSVAVRNELMGNAAAESVLHLRAGRGSSGWILAEPHPEPEHFAVTPPDGGHG